MRFLLLALAACSVPLAPSSPSIDLYAAGDSSRFLLADTNGDGTRDLVVSFTGVDRGISVRIGDVRGRFGTAQRVLVGAATVAAFDLGADGAADLIVGDGQHIGVLPNGHGPMHVLGACRDAVLGATVDGVLTTDGHDLVLHSWDLELARPLEVAPLVPLSVNDIDGDGLADVIGTAVGRAAVRHGTLEGFGPVHLLGDAEGVITADADGDGQDDVIAWSKSHAIAWNGKGTPIAAFGVPSDVTALAAGDLDGDGHPEIAVASRGAVSIDGRPIEGPWTNVKQLAIVRGRLIVADAGFVAVVSP